MDVARLLPPKPPLDNLMAATWLRALVKQRPTAAGTHEQWKEHLNDVRPTTVVGEADQLMAWMDQNQLWEGQAGQFTLTLNGVAVGLSKDGPRLNTSQAWAELHTLMTHVAWLNAAPVEHAPMKIADVLLFGGMTEPGKQHHGDLDAVILFEPKEEGGHQKAEHTLEALGLGHVLRPANSTLPSFRVAVRDWLGELQPFLSLDDRMRTLEVLMEHDPEFGCYSLMGRTWTVGALEKTTADDEAWLVKAALDAGQNNTGRQAEVAARLAALPEMGRPTFDVDGLDPDRARWWQYLDRPGLRGASRVRVADHVNTDKTPERGRSP